MFLSDLHTRGSAGCLGSSLLPEDKIRKTVTSHPAMITIVRQAWLGFMFSNLPHSLLAGRLKQTTWSHHFTSLSSYLAPKGGPDVNLEIFRNIDGILDRNVDCPEERQ